MDGEPELFTRGRELHQAGNLREAEGLYRLVLRGGWRDARVWFALAQLCEADRRPAEAAACFRQALELQPREAEGHFLLGSLFLNQQQYPEAEASYRRCLQLRPDHLAGLVNLGFALGEQNRLDEAKACYEQALQLRTDVAEIHHNLGNVFREQGQFDDAMACYDRAIALRPDYAKAYINRGIALVPHARLDEALADLQRGVELEPNLADAHGSLGAALSVLQRFDEALAHYERALALKPDYAEAAWNRALLWLLLGDYRRGWPEYEWRWRCKGTMPLPAFSQPRWDGAPLEGKTILLYGEQGLGDTLHFVRYAPLVKARGGRVVVQCQDTLLPLLSRTPGIDQLVAWGATPPVFDVYAPLMSLPAAFRTTLETIPADIPYVSPDPTLVASWRQHMAPIRGFRVGISWRGSPRHAWDRIRSAPLEQLEPLARVEGVQLISLQKGLGSEQLHALGDRFPVVNLGDRLDESAGPFMDTAAVLANLDLVVTVDTALAHLAGAMGRPAWVALISTPDWRWLMGRDDSPWYPTLRLFRQAKLGDWSSVFRPMAEALSHEVRARPRRPISIEVSPSELLDRITLLQLKIRREADDEKARGMAAELAPLEAAWRESGTVSSQLAELESQLRAANERRLQTEDELRQCEQEQDFGPRFVALARSARQEADGRQALLRELDASF